MAREAPVVDRPAVDGPRVERPLTRVRAGARPKRAWVVIVALATGALAVVLLVAQFGASRLGIEPFFDEMWRLDLIRSADPSRNLLPGVTPIPPGWIGIFRAVAPAFGADWAGYRLVEEIIWAGGVAALVILLREWCRPVHAGRAADAVTLATAAAAALSTAAMAAFIELSYFNQYRFEVAYGVALTTCCVLLGRHRFAFPAFLALVVAAPLFVIAPLAVLPALVVATAWWAATADPDRRARRLGATVAAGAVSAVMGAVVHVGVYESMSNVGLEELWSDQTLAHADGDPFFVGRTLEFVRNGVVGVDAATTGVGGVLVAAVLLASFAAGAVTITTRWPWYPLLLLSGWVSVLVGGVITDGPVTPVRVTVGFYWLAFVTVALGFFHGIAWSLGRMRARSGTAVGVLGGVLVVLFVVLWPVMPDDYDTGFARGLLQDLDVVAASPTRENLVLTYHPMAHVYAHDRLVNDAPGDRDVVVLGQRGLRSTRLDDVDGLVRRHLPDGGTLWCVVPYAYGPTRAARACPVPATAREVARDEGAQALIVGYAIPG